MTRRHGISCIVLLAAVAAAADQPAGYAPVTPSRAVPVGLQAQLAAVRDWVEGRDYASAAEGVKGVEALAHLAGFQSSEPRWRMQAAALRDACTRLAEAVKSRDASRCNEALQTCADRLAALAREPALSAPAPDYRPQGGTKTWMLLLDGGYVEAKSARTPAQLAEQALALAEMANAAAYLRTEPRWRQYFTETRAAALEAAKPAADLAAGRQVLKAVYQRCEACHQAYQR